MDIVGSIFILRFLEAYPHSFTLALKIEDDFFIIEKKQIDMIYHFFNSSHSTKGSDSTELELPSIAKLAVGRTKENLPCISTTIQRSVFCPNGWYFIDIDIPLGADTIIENADWVFSNMPYIAALQYSASKKLHVHIKGVESRTEKEWRENYFYYVSLTFHIFNKQFGIDYIGTEGAFDTHNAKPAQLLFISSYAPIENEGWKGIILDRETKSKLLALYPQLHNKICEDKTVSKTSTTLVGKDGNAVGDKLCVDRYTGFGKYYGNELRYRISIVAASLFGDGAKEWCDKYFYQINNRGVINSIYAIPTGSLQPNPAVYSWLIEKGYLAKESSVNLNYDLELADNQYLSDLNKEILKIIEQNNFNCEIIAPTGTGKTRLINSRSCESSLFSVADVDGLAFALNAVVVVPYNATNLLYSNLSVVSSKNSRKENEALVASNTPFVCVFDQFVKYANALKDRVIIVDEAHLIFTSQLWRDKTTGVLNVLKFCDRKILFTATPEGEAAVLDIPQITIWKKQKPVHTYIYKIEEGNEFYQEKYLIDNLEGDQICIFDDRNNLLLAAYCSIKGLDVTHFRADTKDADVKCKNLLTEELIRTKYLISTNIGIQGLNFNNEGEIDVIYCYREGEDYTSNVQQAVGRFRKAKKVNLHLLCVANKQLNVDEQKKKVEDINTAFKEAGLSDFNFTDQTIIEKYDIAKTLEDYQNQFSTLEHLYKILKEDPKFVVIKRMSITESKARYNNPIRSQEDKQFVSDFVNNQLNTESACRYYKEDLKLLGQLSMFYSKAQILALYEAKDKNTMFSSFAEEYLNIARYMSSDKSELIESKTKAIEFIRTVEDKGIRLAFQQTIRNIDKALNVKNQNFNTTVEKVQYLIDELQDVKIEVIKQKSEGGKKGGKIGGKIGGKNGSPKKKVINLQTNEVFDSVSDLAASLGKSVGYVSKQKNILWRAR